MRRLKSHYSRNEVLFAICFARSQWHTECVAITVRESYIKGVFILMQYLLGYILVQFNLLFDWVSKNWISLLPPFRDHQAYLQCDPHDAIYSNDPALFHPDQAEISEDVYIMPDAWKSEMFCCPVLIPKMFSRIIYTGMMWNNSKSWFSKGEIKSDSNALTNITWANVVYWLNTLWDSKT